MEFKNTNNKLSTNFNW